MNQNDESPAGDAADLVAAVIEDDPAEQASQLVADEALQDPSATILSGPAGDLLASPESIKAAVEAILFTSPDPLTPRRIAKALGDIEVMRVHEAIAALREDLTARGSGLQVVEAAGGFQMGTREKYSEFILRLGLKKKPQALSPATLETLAIIAYRQPITRTAVETIRGVESSGTIRNLLDLEIIEITGRQEVVGRPPLYGTTERFLRAFGLKNLKDLPAIRGLKERFKQAAANAQPAAGAAAAPDTTDPHAEPAPPAVPEM